jgi:transcription antitermination factor NusG
MVETTRPAFGNYAFVGIRGDSVEIARESPNLNHMIRREGVLIVVSDREIEDIQRREKAGEFDLLPEDMSLKFCKGVEVHIVAGPFEGRTGIVTRAATPKGHLVQIDVGGHLVALPLVLLQKCA